MSRPTIAQALREGAARILAAHKAYADAGGSPGLDVQLLLSKATGRSRSGLFAWSDSVLDAAEEAEFEQLLARRVAGEPVAHLVGSREFWSLPLAVSPATLIPRADTECLVEQALALGLPPSARVLDLGTGSGAIALALATEQPGWDITATDCSEDALRLARVNSLNLNLTRVRLCQSDWFDGIGDERFDLIVSNPPYIAVDDPHLHQGDLRYEPSSALVGGHDGLADLRRIIAESPQHLASGGWLLLEHGYDQAEAVADLLQKQGYASIGLRRDYGGQPRVTQGRWVMQSPVTRFGDQAGNS